MIIKKEKNSLRGKKARAAGGRFELKVRKDLESKGWIVDKWSNNVELPTKDLNEMWEKEKPTWEGKLIPAKRKYNPFNKALAIGTGFPDFIAFKRWMHFKDLAFSTFDGVEWGPWSITGVEVKSNGYLKPEEKEKIKWLLDKKIFSKILVAKKGKKRGEIIYEEVL